MLSSELVVRQFSKLTHYLRAPVVSLGQTSQLGWQFMPGQFTFLAPQVRGTSRIVVEDAAALSGRAKAAIEDLDNPPAYSIASV